MVPARLEHVNFTVTDARKTADMLCRLFDWKIRWPGDALAGGYSVHVGTDQDYLAIYSVDTSQTGTVPHNLQIAGLHHIGVVVDDLDATEQRVTEAGFEITTRADYDPGRRFYFLDGDGVEYEVVSYA